VDQIALFGKSDLNKFDRELERGEGYRSMSGKINCTHSVHWAVCVIYVP